MRAIVCQPWSFQAHSDDYFEQALAHLLAWARVHRAPPPHQHVLIPPDALDTLTYLLGEILDILSLHPRVEELHRLVDGHY